MRATEALSTRLKDIDFGASHARVHLRGEYTKTRQDRNIFLTKETTSQLKLYLDWKYRRRRIYYTDENTGAPIRRYFEPKRRPEDLVFGVYHENQDKGVSEDNLHTTYGDFHKMFARTLDRIGMGEREDHANRRKITLHSFRRFVKTTISDLGYQDFSEWFIGHSGSTYWRKKDADKAELFGKIESYLSFLNFAEMEAKGADISTQLEEKEKRIQVLEEKQEKYERFMQSLIDAGQLKPPKS